MKVISH